MKRADLIRTLEEAGCVLIRHGGNHDLVPKFENRLFATRTSPSRDQRTACTTDSEKTCSRGSLSFFRPEQAQFDRSSDADAQPGRRRTLVAGDLDAAAAADDRD